MKTRLVKSVCLLAMLILISCKKDKPSANELIIGNWRWIKTISPYGGQETNPQTEGYSRSFVFTRNGQMQEYRNYDIINSSDYSIETDPSNPENNIITSTIINSHFYFESDTLIFSEAYVDGPIIYFVKGANLFHPI